MTTVITQIEEAITTWCNDNPSSIYGDRGDVVADNLAEGLIMASTKDELIAAKEAITEWLWEGSLDYRLQIESEQFNECMKQIEVEGKDELDESELEQVRDHFNGMFQIDDSDLLNTCLRNWSGKIVATLKDRNGEYFESPCASDHSTEEWKRLRRKWKRAFKLSKADADQLVNETMYAYTYLKVCGSVDLQQLWDSEKPITHVRLNKHSSIIIHNIANGSGNCWEPPITIDRWFRADIRVDHPSYGVDAVYGMVGEFWRNEIETKSVKEKSCKKKSS